MRTAVLLGSRDTKRSIYFEKAARQTGLPFLFVDWEEWRNHGFSHEGEFFGEKEYFVKIDPPVWKNSCLTDLNSMVDGYQRDLEVLGRDSCITQYLNPPEHLLALLDKRECKDTLKHAGLAVTEVLSGCGTSSSRGGALPSICGVSSRCGVSSFKSGVSSSGNISCAEELLTCMQEQHVSSVFLKPVNGSGAAGVTAFRFQPSTGRMVAYSCALPVDGTTELTQNADIMCTTANDSVCINAAPAAGFVPLVNTKKLRTFTDKSIIFPLLDSLLSLGCIVERWYPKADFEGFSYDLRGVFQEGRLDFLLARLSKGPITNLHLNNHPLEANRLGLPGRVMDEIGELCSKAMDCYPGLKSAGIDILLERGSLKPRIIEMNGQGDLLYQDIYYENRIYRHQAEMMKRWLEKLD